MIPSTANAMVNWYAQQAMADLTGTKDPQCNDDETKAFLQGIVEWAATLVTDSFGRGGINGKVSAEQWQAVERGKGFPSPEMQRGQVVHDLTADILELMFPEQWKYRRGGTGDAKGPDYTHRNTGYRVELKTGGGDPHKPGGEFKRFVVRGPENRKALYQDCGWAQYHIPRD
ncbi:hypothetical protein [Dactylosporangium sp. CA-233914]|uniref:hypothetical protein n=1 Tax=Dactylosporangium sp. CA-233914 TaxID=3239934 RepID=UPI003D8A7124